MAVPFWEPVPSAGQLMHCKKLRAWNSTENPLEPMNSKCILYLKKKLEKHLSVLHVYSFMLLYSLSSLSLSPFSLSLHTPPPTIPRALYPPCMYPFVPFIFHPLCLPYQSFKGSVWIVKASSKTENSYLSPLSEPCRLRVSDTRKRVDVFAYQPQCPEWKL